MNNIICLVQSFVDVRFYVIEDVSVKLYICLKQNVGDAFLSKPTFHDHFNLTFYFLVNKFTAMWSS